MQSFYELTLTDLEKIIGALGNEKFRARQLYKWVYNKGILNFSLMTNISKSLRTVFADMFSMALPSITEVVPSGDGSIKFGLTMSDGNVVESVLMPDEDRSSLCVSTQIGCRMGCKFCVTGKIGFRRNLSVSEIIGQVMAVKQYLGEKYISNIVFMGMGEPIDNLDNVLVSLEILKAELGLDFSHRRITISSVGLLDGLQAIQPKVASIAISLNAADDQTRSFLMPINRLYPVRKVINFVKGFKGSRRIRITFEYVMLKGINDSMENAKSLAQLLAGVKCKVNLIPLNESPYIEFKTPSQETVEQFQEYLHEKHFITIVRNSRGKDIWGGCGQLGMKYLEELKTQ
ncbi:MAG: 23S rRNA (adenine(2503)-C(2))-methyltransferase RlmN [Syntrophobacterales bacterium]|jgi:23S rRNA (adenine2503-C2)-methyltransferase|nr:23S rRNA (adenine(2503)-C(2))-methyltransferase RlmN [Syntrophobacterales bacterium]